MINAHTISAGKPERKMSIAEDRGVDVRSKLTQFLKKILCEMKMAALMMEAARTC